MLNPPLFDQCVKWCAAFLSLSPPASRSIFQVVSICLCPHTGLGVKKGIKGHQSRRVHSISSFSSWRSLGLKGLWNQRLSPLSWHRFIHQIWHNSTKNWCVLCDNLFQRGFYCLFSSASSSATMAKHSSSSNSAIEFSAIEFSAETCSKRVRVPSFLPPFPPALQIL